MNGLGMSSAVTTYALVIRRRREGTGGYKGMAGGDVTIMVV